MHLHYIQRQCRLLLMCMAEHTDTHIEEEIKEDISKVTLVWRAIKLPTYTVALIPITVGTAAAYLQTGQYFGNRYLKLLISSILIIAWLNLSNDVYDFDTGADKNKKESVVNLVGSRTGTHYFAWLLLACGFTGLSWVSMEAGSLRPIFLLACAIICGYIYQDNTKIFMAKYYWVRLHTVFGAALAAGLVAARMFARKQLPHAIIL